MQNVYSAAIILKMYLLLQSTCFFRSGATTSIIYGKNYAL